MLLVFHTYMYRDVRFRECKATDKLRLIRHNSQLLMFVEIIAVCSQIHTKHINTLCGQNVEYSTGGTYSDHWTAKCVKPFK